MFNARLQVDSGKAVICENDEGYWFLLDGYKAQESICEVVYYYDYDKNNCDQSLYVWSRDQPIKMHYYEKD